VQWRVGRHRSAIWKSLVLPAGGTALSWLLLMTLGLPAADYARSYVPMVRNVSQEIRAQTPPDSEPACVEFENLNRGQIAAFQYHGQLRLIPAKDSEQCPWLLVDATTARPPRASLNLSPWSLRLNVRRRDDNSENIRLYQRKSPIKVN